MLMTPMVTELTPPRSKRAAETSELLQPSTSGDNRDENGITFLMSASQQGNYEVVRKLIDHEVDVTAVDYDDWTALHYACKHGHLDIAVALLDSGAVLEARDVGGWTPLMWSCYKGRTDVVRMLLQHGANPNIKSEHHMSSLIWAAGRGYVEIVELLLEHNAKVNTADKYGSGPLLWAARKGLEEIVGMLIDNGANVDNAGMYSWTPLIVVAKNGFLECVRLILDCNPNTNAVDKDGFTALTWAVRGGHLEIVEELVEKGAYVNLNDRDGDSILIHGAKTGNRDSNRRDIVKVLLNKYADIDVQGSDGKTALYHVVEKGYYEIACDLMEFSPDLDLATKDGDTPLMKAVRSRNIEMVTLLLARGAKVNAVDKKGDTALHIALRGRSRKATELLLRNPKNSRLLYKPNKANETPYSIDSNHQRSILTQVFGARHLNASDTTENLLGYELYGSTIADVLSEPSLCTPITVGLYAKWGSGKSFLLDKLKNEMMSFEHQMGEPTFEPSVLVFFLCFSIASIIGIILGTTTMWQIGLGVGLGLLLAVVVFLGVIWFGTERREWNIAYTVSVYLANKLGKLQLILQVLFMNPPKSTREVHLVRFLFSGYTRIVSGGGEQSIATMLASLCEQIEKEFGILATRLYSVFKNRKADSGRYRAICCVPYFVIAIIFFCSLVAAICLISIYPLKDIEKNNKPVYGALIGLGIVVGVIIIGHVYTWIKVIAALFRSQRSRILHAATEMKSSKFNVERFIQHIKHEVQIINGMVRCINSFTGRQYRLVIYVDGLDSSEQEKLLQVLDILNILFSENESPFITILAIDPHIIIKGIEQNLPGLFRDSNINGHDYLRNIVHLPVFLQNQGHPVPTVVIGSHLRATNESHDHRESPPKIHINDKEYLTVKSASRRSSGADESANKREVQSPLLARRGRPEFLRNESIMSSLSLDKFSIRGNKHRHPDRFSMGSSSYFASTTDLSKTLLKHDYFSDVNPRNMRRLLNIIAVTGRLLRAYDVEYSWHRLATWINLTEQWPYRTAWIVWYYEDTSDLDESTSLKDIYEKVLPRVPVSREQEPLLEIDRNARKLEALLSGMSPMLNVSDLKKFLPCSINMDPFLRKIIRDYMKNFDSQLLEPVPGFPKTSSYDNFSVVAGTPQTDRWYPFLGAGFAPPMKPSDSRLRQLGSFPLMQQQMMQLMSPAASIAGSTRTMSRLTPKVFLRGGTPQKPLSGMNLTHICDTISRLEGLNRNMLSTYIATIKENNLNGFVLSHCDLEELKQVVGMNFGDWQLFRAMILALREREEEQMNGIASGIAPHFMAISTEHLNQLDDDSPSRNSNDSTESNEQADSGVSCGREAMASAAAAVTTTNAQLNILGHHDRQQPDPFQNYTRRFIPRRNSMAMQVALENQMLHDVIDEFSESGSDHGATAAGETYDDIDAMNRLTAPPIDHQSSDTPDIDAVSSPDDLNAKFKKLQKSSQKKRSKTSRPNQKNLTISELSSRVTFSLSGDSEGAVQLELAPAAEVKGKSSKDKSRSRKKSPSSSYADQPAALSTFSDEDLSDVVDLIKDGPKNQFTANKMALRNKLQKREVPVDISNNEVESYSVASPLLLDVRDSKTKRHGKVERRDCVDVSPTKGSTDAASATTAAAPSQEPVVRIIQRQPSKDGDGSKPTRTRTFSVTTIEDEFTDQTMPALSRDDVSPENYRGGDDADVYFKESLSNKSSRCSSAENRLDSVKMVTWKSDVEAQRGDDDDDHEVDVKIDVDLENIDTYLV
ncbi:uncharacterized protein LOC141906167 isoform X2 [Tubulanus polymorphus]|uniref:uncharacterized protein LOC141906167 isoform X2 n=1 Tax=Tubulanus polymorphus TaxID=672921 RepID=UPI003DA26220